MRQSKCFVEAAEVRLRSKIGHVCSTKLTSPSEGGWDWIRLLVAVRGTRRVWPVFCCQHRNIRPQHCTISFSLDEFSKGRNVLKQNFALSAAVARPAKLFCFSVMSSSLDVGQNSKYSNHVLLCIVSASVIRQIDRSFYSGLSK